jgi:hypothetical protein
MFLLAPAVAAAVGGCSSSPPQNTKYPPQKEGCDVQVFPEEPTGVQTENIGSVQASCGDTVADDACMRTLKDEACKLGADVLWGVEKPEMRGGKKRMAGRAAHTKGGGPPGGTK